MDGNDRPNEKERKKRRKRFRGQINKKMRGKEPKYLSN
jgi:hypothetical protein